ncbi:hypothetical protein SLI_8077 [Streptomyces lividans 1326]|uniref:Uncharacterized protein n=1 Tax=Streptomyces lividans 1326 TaxID=1200984 RepID=A0A7U9E2B2_STRLI|nr:hypothetical protein SLI_8077 [Streptomyces lividans 1326]
MGLDGVRWVDRVVAHGGVDVGVACENLRDVMSAYSFKCSARYG